MSGANEKLAILTFHSISNGDGPTNIPPDVFAMRMETIAELGVDAISLGDVKSWLSGVCDLTRPTVAITFDDAFEDFAETAFPILERFGLKSCVFAPTGRIGGLEEWAPAGEAKRKLMNWATAAFLSTNGVDFGSHARTHCDLRTLSDAALENELTASRKALEDRLSREILHFAPPYGASDARVRAAIARHYALSAGVRLDYVRKASPTYDLPRIEMHYYRNRATWRAFLSGQGQAHLNFRRALRGARGALSALTQKQSRRMQ